jgi:hypothetical protein
LHSAHEYQVKRTDNDNTGDDRLRTIDVFDYDNQQVITAGTAGLVDDCV